MASAPDGTSSGGRPATATEGQHIVAPGLQPFVFALFFIFGGVTGLNDVLIPALKELFTLNYTQAMLVQFCFFTAYFLIGIPAAMLVKRIGYMRGAVAGLVTMMMGCLLFVPAGEMAIYALFLLAFFVLASGVVIMQVVANPLISLLGPPETAHSRLTFGQAFNSLGTTLFPFFGSILILGSLATADVGKLSGAALAAFRREESQAIVHGYLGLAVALAMVAGVVWMFRDRLKGERQEGDGGFAGFDLLRRPRFAYGVLCIFLYVGAEVSIGSLIISYLSSDRVLAEPQAVAGRMVSIYWGGAMVGRFVGSAVLRVVSPGKVPAFVACGAIVLIAISANSQGALAAYTLLGIGLMNSVMFPTIFGLASEKLGSRTADGSGIINVAMCGGAVIPLLTAGLADTSGSLGFSLLVPALCYVTIAGFGVYARRPA